MAQVMNEAVKKYNALSTITVVSAVVFLVLSAWAAFQLEWGWGMHIAPTAAFAAVALVVMLVAFVYMERMKKQHDLVTYARCWRLAAASRSIATRSRGAVSAR